MVGTRLSIVIEPVSDCDVGAQRRAYEDEHQQRRLFKKHCENNGYSSNRDRNPDIPGNHCEYGAPPMPKPKEEGLPSAVISVMFTAKCGLKSSKSA